MVSSGFPRGFGVLTRFAIAVFLALDRAGTAVADVPGIGAVMFFDPEPAADGFS